MTFRCKQADADFGVQGPFCFFDHFAATEQFIQQILAPVFAIFSVSRLFCMDLADILIIRVINGLKDFYKGRNIPTAVLTTVNMRLRIVLQYLRRIELDGVRYRDKQIELSLQVQEVRVDLLP